jgi:isocitrate dehydrogenase
MYWARALANQTKDAALRAIFEPIAVKLEANESKIFSELNGAQGKTVDIGGYYHPDPARTARTMRPSATLNAILDGMGA